MKVTKPPTWNGAVGIILLLIILTVLFWRSFLPGYVHFNNDAPLGMQTTKWTQVPGAFTGTWADLGSIGGNAGVWPPDVSELIRWIIGPIGLAKFFPPIALLILGLGAWTFFRQLKLSPLAATLGACAATLNSSFFASACWGVGPQQIGIGMDFFALALVVSNVSETPILVRCVRLALAGLCVGMNVMEAADIGAIFSMFVAAFVFYKAITDEGGPILAKAGHGFIRVAVIALFAGFIAMQTVVSLVGTEIQGVVGTSKNGETAVQHWNWATEWSLPKIETLGLFVPGVFGYKYDTPNNMMPFLQDSYQGGVYWGLVGCDPSWDQYFANGEKGPEGQGILRFAGGQNYVGILVMLVAIWTIAQSLRRQNSLFSKTQQRLIWFWTAMLVGSLLLSWGRFAPFYKIIYMLPYFSSIRNPAKFILVFSWAIVILFAYGVHALSQRYLDVPVNGKSSFLAKLKNWWKTPVLFDRVWTVSCLMATFACLLGAFMYWAEKPTLVKYLQGAGFPDKDMAEQMAGFSVEQVGWFVLLYLIAVVLFLLVLAGIFGGKRARIGGFLLGAFLVVDLARGDLPYITHWNYIQKYESNPIVDLLRNKPYEHRVLDLPFRVPEQLEPSDRQQISLFEQIYRIEWLQQLFPYYNVQSLDVVQMPRLAADLEAYESALAPHSDSTSYLLARHWQLTNTRYILGGTVFQEVLNQFLDPVQRRFQIVQRFSIAAKPGIENPTQLEEMTAVPDDNGACALIEFTGALPRVKLYANWQLNTNDEATLQELAAPDFDPLKTVLISTPLPEGAGAGTNQNEGTVEFKSYAPKDSVFATHSTLPSVMLFNDKYDPNWRVTVDGKPAPLLRCNFIMRGTLVPAGDHTVEFRFIMPNGYIYVTIAGDILAVLLCGFLYFSYHRRDGTKV